MVARLSKLVGRAVALAAVPALLAFTASGAQAQQEGAVTGQVVDAQTAEPVSGAQVMIQGTELGVITGGEGRYRLTDVPARRVTIMVRVLGYGEANREVRVRAGETSTVNFELRPRAITLDEIVVTGVAGQTLRTKTPFEVSTLNFEEAPVSQRTASGMLQGKVAGVTVVSGSGRPGSEPSVLLRGATSIDATGRNQEPLYVVDGVILNSGFVDLGSLDVKNVEVVKGAAAASLYGSRAANGVVEITTQDGAEEPEGSIRYTLRTEFGTSDLEGEFFLPQHHEWQVNEAGEIVNSNGSTCTVFNECSDPVLAGNAPWRGEGEAPDAWNTVASNPWPVNFGSQVDQFFGGDDFVENHVSVTGRSGGTSFHVSFAHTDENGVMPGQEGFQRYSVRANVDQRIRNDLTVASSAFYSTSTQDNFAEFQGNAMFDLTRMKSGVNLRGCEDDASANCMDDPDNLMLVADPVNLESPNPIYQLLVQDNKQQRGRFLGSATVEYTPVDFMSLQGNVSYDRLDRQDENFFPKGFRTITDNPTLNDGFLSKFNQTQEALNLSVDANLDFALTEEIENTTRLRYLHERQDNNFNQSSGSNFAVEQVPTLDNLQNTETFDLDSGLEEIRSESYLLISNFDIRDRYVVDGLVRNDGSSLFGPDERRNWYWRAAGAWRVTQEPWFDVGLFDELKLRYSYGTAGNRPAFGARFETFSVEAGRVSPVTLGNTELKPEFSTEQEMGFDAILADRFVLGFTYAHTVTDNQLLPVPLPSFSGFGTQWQNAGELTSDSWEVSLRASVLETEDFSWSARATWDRTTSEITDLDIPAFRYGVAGQGLGTIFFAREGEELGTFYGGQFAQECSHLPEGVSCDGFVQDENGFLVWVGDGSLEDNDWGESSDVDIRGSPVQWGTPFLGECDDRETGERTLFCPVGNSTPDWAASLANSFEWKGLSVYTLLHAEYGFDVYNQPLQWATFRRNSGIFDEAGTPPEQQKPLGYYDEWYQATGLRPSSEFVEDGSYLKLREVSVRYRFDENQLQAVPGLRGFSGLSLMLTGRNLATITDYRGFDPEIGRAGGDTGSAALARVAGFQYPNFRTITGGIELTF